MTSSHGNAKLFLMMGGCTAVSVDVIRGVQTEFFFVILLGPKAGLTYLIFAPSPLARARSTRIVLCVLVGDYFVMWAILVLVLGSPCIYRSACIFHLIAPDSVCFAIGT